MNKKCINLDQTSADTDTVQRKDMHYWYTAYICWKSFLYWLCVFVCVRVCVCVCVCVCVLELQLMPALPGDCGM